MDKLLRPTNLDISPNDSDAPATFKYWLATFRTFLQEVEKKVEDEDKKALLIYFLSSAVYPYVEDCDTYKAALEVLKTAFIKKKNDIFARHILATRKQQSGETLEQFLQALKVLSKDCTFKPVSAEQYREDLLRDAFINGLSSSAIRQRLLEKDDLALQIAFEQTYTLHRAYEQSSSYSGALSAATGIFSDSSPNGICESSSTSPTLNATAPTKFRKCFYCGAPVTTTDRDARQEMWIVTGKKKPFC